MLLDRADHDELEQEALGQDEEEDENRADELESGAERREVPRRSAGAADRRARHGGSDNGHSAEDG